MITSLKNMNPKERWLNILPGILISLVMSFTLFIYAPLSLYFTNKEEFWFDFKDIIPVISALFGIFFVAQLILYGLMLLIHKYAYYASVVIGFIVYVSSVIQGNFQTSYIPLIDGSTIDWNALSKHRISTIVLWVIVTLVTVLIYKFFKFKGFKYVVNVTFVMLFALFLITTILLGVQNKGFNSKPDLCVTRNNYSEYSSDTNFIVFVVDATDASKSLDLINEHPEYKDVLKDFTYYDNMAGLFPYTDHAIPVMLGAEPYYCEQPFLDYVGEAYRTSPFLTDLSDRGYNLQVYEDLAPTYEDSIERFDNVENVSTSFNSFWDAMILQLKMVGIRYAPFDLKRFCEVLPSDISVSQTTGRNDITVFTSSNIEFKDALSEPVSYTENKVFKFIHIEGAHYPYTYDEDLNIIPPSEGSYSRNIHATFNVISNYIDYLKENNLYDNSVIIIAADHGCSESRSTFDRYNPLFIVKGINEEHSDFNVSRAPVSFADLNTAYTRLLDGAASDEIFDWSENDTRNREFIIYYTHVNNELDGKPYDMEYEYTIPNHVSDISSIHPTGKIYILKHFSLKFVFDVFYKLTRNYGIAIILITLIIKFLLIPMNVWVLKNSIKMVKMKPEINRIKINHFGDKDRISQETSLLYKKEKYKVWLSVVPMVVQLAIMMLLLDVIKEIAYEEGVSMFFLGYNLSLYTYQYPFYVAIVASLLAGLSSFILCVAQNKFDILQIEQSRLNKLFVMAVSVGLSAYLATIVSLGVILYWIVSNLFAAVWVILIYYTVKPQKYVDYEALEQTKKQLRNLESIGEKESLFDPNKKRENEDYKRFFSIRNKHLVFYSESNGFYKYFKGFINEILEHSDVPIHYITNDPNDNIFELAKKEPRIKPYYIGEKKLIILMMKMDADVVVMTVPDLDNFHIKRSYVRNDIEYILVQHGIGSINLTYRTGSVDHYDTIFCCGTRQKEEIRAIEKAYNLPEKTCVEIGYPLFDEMFANFKSMPKIENKRKKILIAPSWQDGNISETCLDKILDSIKDKDYNIIVRPHPQHVRHCPALFEDYKIRYKDYENIDIQTDFSSNNPVLEADVLITDWSDIVWEFSLITERPAVFINTKMKEMNPEWKKIDIVPLNIEYREVLGKSVNIEDTGKVSEVIEYVITNKESYREAILKVKQEQLYNHGNSAYFGGRYILEAVMKKVEARRKTNEQ